MRAALNRYAALKDGQNLPPHKDAVLKLTGRLLVHFENSSNRLFAEGEVRADGEPRALLRSAQGLAELIRDNLAYALPDGAQEEQDVFGRYRQ